MDYLTLLATIAPVFLIIGAGYVIRRIRWLNAEADASLMRVIVNLLYPCLILDTILGNRALDDPGNVILAPLVGFGTVVLGYAASYLLAPIFGLREPRQRRTFAFTAGIYNYGYLALPLAQKLFDAPAGDSRTTAVLFIHNLGVEVALWTVGLLLLQGRSHEASPPKAADESTPTRRSFQLPPTLTRVLNPPVLAILFAAALHFAGARHWMPGVALSAVHSLGAAAIPLGLVLTGATFADEMRNLSGRNHLGVGIGACALRLGLLPILFLALAKWLPAPVELQRVILIQAAMPSAVIPVLLARHYGGDAGTAMRIVLITSLAALLTIPLWIQLGTQWLGW
ncbi:MAG TPA: AEC family transporter [Chthoniobacteraceae bacterium]|jgi:hypothetical protein